MRLLPLWMGIGMFCVAGMASAADGPPPTSLDCCCPAMPETCCAHCGGHGCCHKVCKVVCVMEEVKKTVWTVKCSEFCVPNPSLCGGKCCACGETSCCCERPCSPPPKCGRVRIKKELVKKEIVCKVPTYKCVVVCCGRCPGDCCECRALEGPPAPVAESTPTKEPVPHLAPRKITPAGNPRPAR
ncbi:MAG: hypothetical protein JXB10_00735 [Pirellulales bacterium]|nr:hypothetical protein [Pirellulales bacterium]